MRFQSHDFWPHICPCKNMIYDLSPLHIWWPRLCGRHYGDTAGVCPVSQSRTSVPLPAGTGSTRWRSMSTWSSWCRRCTSRAWWATRTALDCWRRRWSCRSGCAGRCGCGCGTIPPHRPCSPVIGETVKENSWKTGKQHWLSSSMLFDIIVSLVIEY